MPILKYDKTAVTKANKCLDMLRSRWFCELKKKREARFLRCKSQQARFKKEESIERKCTIRLFIPIRMPPYLEDNN